MNARGLPDGLPLADRVETFKFIMILKQRRYAMLIAYINYHHRLQLGGNKATDDGDNCVSSKCAYAFASPPRSLITLAPTDKSQAEAEAAAQPEHRLSD